MSAQLPVFTLFYSILLYAILTDIDITGHFKTDSIIIIFLKKKGCVKKLFLKAQNKKAHKINRINTINKHIKSITVLQFPDIQNKQIKPLRSRQYHYIP